MVRKLFTFTLLSFYTSLTFAQEVKVTGISRIAVYATLAKGTPVSQIFDLPDLITPKGLKFEVQGKIKLFKTQPPRSIDTILDLTEYFFSQYLKHNLIDQELPGDFTIDVSSKNKLPGLPNTKPHLVIGDKAEGKGGFDEAVEVDFNWSFSVIDGKWFKPTLFIRAELYESGAAPVWKKEITINSTEIDYKVMKELYNINIDPAKGFSKDYIKKGGIPGNMLVDAYHKGLEKLLNSPD